MSSRKKHSVYSFAVRVAICLSVVSFIVYVYIDQRNHLTELRRVIPKLEKGVKRLQEENVSLRFEINRFRDPRHLLELARQPQYRHLRFPSSEEVIVIEESAGGIEE